MPEVAAGKGYLGCFCRESEGWAILDVDYSYIPQLKVLDNSAATSSLDTLARPLKSGQ